MKRSAVAAVVALVLVVGSAIGYRSWSRSGPAPSAAAAAVPAAAAAAAPPLVLPPDGSAGSIALRWIEHFSDLRRKPPATPQEEELARSRERQFADEIKARLAKEPARWADVLEVVSEEDPQFGRKVVDALKDAVGDAAEPELARLLQAGRHRETRMASATLIGARTTSDSLWSLIAAAQQDPDSGVRYQALSEVLKRQGRASSDAERAAIDEALRRHAESDPDPAIRQFALRASGQAQDPPPPPPPARLPRKSVDGAAPRK